MKPVKSFWGCLMSDIWFTSDHHFGHTNVIEYSRRPFADAKEMDAVMIERWNERIKEGDRVYYLGDLSFRKADQTLAILHKLNGLIFFIRGNHDRRLKGAILERFEWVKDYFELKKVIKRKIILCHYPFDTWNGAHHGNIHLHGHSHNSLKTKRKGRLDIGVDGYDFYPWHIDEVVEEINKQPDFEPIDHHKKKERENGLALG